MTASKGVVVISSLAAFDPEHINRRNNADVCRLLEGKIKCQLKPTTRCGVKFKRQEKVKSVIHIFYLSDKPKD